MPTPSGLVTKQELIDAQLDTAHLGRVVNSKDASGAPISTSTNRTGGVNKTLDTLETEYLEAIQGAGGVSIGVWTSGVTTFTAYNEYAVYNGIPYKPRTATGLPYVAQGADPTAAPDDANVQPYQEITEAQVVALVDEQSPRISGVVFASVTDLKLGIKNDGGSFDFTQFPEYTRIEWLGRYARSDGGSNWGLLKFGSHTEDGGSIFSIDANTYIEANHSRSVLLEKFGVKGDDSDESVQIRACFDFVRNTGRTIKGVRGKTYQCNRYLMLEGANINLNYATLKFAITGNSTNLQTKGSASVENIILYQAGTPSGDLGLAGQRLLFALDAKNCSHKNITFKCDAFGGAPHNVIGNCENVKIKNIKYESGNWGMGTIVHWATESDSLVEDYLNLTYSAGALNPTTHPCGISITNIKGRNLEGTGNLVSLLFLSGVYLTNASNVGCNSASRAISVIAGDYADEFAPSEIKSLICTGITVNNISCRDIKKRGIVIDGSGLLTSRVLDMLVTINNPNVSTLSSSNSEYGLYVENVKKLKISGGKLSAFPTNLLRTGVKGFTLEDVEISRCNAAGLISSPATGDKNTGIRIIRGKIWGNNTDNIALPNNSGVRLENTDGASISGTEFGDKDEGSENQFHSVYVADSCDNVSVESTNTHYAGSNSAIAGQLTTQYSMRLLAHNNISSTPFVTDPSGHVWYQTKSPENVKFVQNLANPPTTGAWKRGDEVEFRDPIAAGSYIGAVCTASGTPGSWSKFGALA